MPVEPWPAQLEVVDALQEVPNLLVLKARQLGLTWYCVFEIVWRMLTSPGLQVGVYSLREEEAVAVVMRIRDVYRQVGELWRLAGGVPDIENNNHWRLSNGSAVRAFSGRSGDSYTFGYVLVDEADLLEDLDRVLRSAEPTLSGGGYLRLVSRSDKTKPDSLFKKMYRAAVNGETEKWKAIFLPWWARPGRTADWYEQERKTSLATRGNLDFVYEQYPASPSEALAPSESDKRFPMAWVEGCSKLAKPLPADLVPLSIAGLMVWELPDPHDTYFIGGDPAEGNPTSDDSAAQVLNKKGRQVARVRGKKEPRQLAHVMALLSEFYATAQPGGGTSWAPVLVERNNHGHACILALQELHPRVPVAIGRDDKPGWLSNAKGNAALYDDLADSLRNRQVLIRDEETAIQLQLIQGADLSAPEGMMDDAADAFGLADQCRKSEVVWQAPTVVPNPHVEPSGVGPHGMAPTQGPPHWQGGPAPFTVGGAGPSHWR